MDTPGKILQTEREKQNKSLKDVARKLKINPEYLQAIEDGSYSLLPAEVFTKAYLRAYAEALGLDSDYILLLYQKPPQKQATKIEKPAKSITDSTETSPSTAYLFTKKGLIALLVIVLITIFSLTYEKQEKIQPPEQVIDTQGRKAPEKERTEDALSLQIVATEITWVSVISDGGKAHEWLLRAGESMSVKAEKKFTIKVGNAGGTRLIFNGKDVGSLGPHGKVTDITLPLQD